MTRRDTRTLSWICVGTILVGHCGGGGGSGPTSPSAPAAATVTGVWDVTFAEVPPPGVLTLTESSGSVSGTLQITGEAGTGTLAGSISTQGQMTLTGTEPAGTPAVLEVTVDAARRSFAGSLRITGSDAVMSLTVRGAKRSSDAPAPTPTPTAAIDKIGFVSSAPPPGGVIHTGLPDPASTRASGVTTGLTMTFSVTSAIDRSARLQVPAAPVAELRSGVAVSVTIRELLLTSVCRYPNAINLVTARLVPASGSDQTPFHEERFSLEYSVIR
jgi:hypothetical protein